MGAVRGGRGSRWRGGRLRVELAWLGLDMRLFDWIFGIGITSFALPWVAFFCRTSVLQGAGWDGWVVFLES
jgi:hypothetical protein